MAIAPHLRGIVTPINIDDNRVNVYADEMGTWHAEIPDNAHGEEISLFDAERIARGAIMRELIVREQKTGESLSDTHSRINRTMGSIELVFHAGGLYEFIENTDNGLTILG